MLDNPSATAVILQMYIHTKGRRSGEVFDVITASRRAAAVVLGERDNDLREETQQRVIAASMLALDAMCAAIGVHPDSMPEEPAEFATVGEALKVMVKALGLPAGADIRDIDTGQVRMLSWPNRSESVAGMGFPRSMPTADLQQLKPATVERIRSGMKSWTTRGTVAFGFTVQIEAGNEDGAVWQAMHPAENVNGPGPAAQVAFDVLANQNVLSLDDGGPWRIVVWSGVDADTSSEPVHVLDHVQFHDAVADHLDAAEAARQD